MPKKSPRLTMARQRLPVGIGSDELRAMLKEQRERIFSAIGVVQLVGEEVIDDPSHGDTAYGALKAAQAQLQAAHDELYNWAAEHLGELSHAGGESGVPS